MRSRQYLRTTRSRMLDRHNESRFAGEVAVWERETGLDYYDEENRQDAVRLPEEEQGSPDADIVGEDSGENGDSSADTEATDPADPLTGGAPAPEAEERTP